MSGIIQNPSGEGTIGEKPNNFTGVWYNGSTGISKILSVGSTPTAPANYLSI